MLCDTQAVENALSGTWPHFFAVGLGLVLVFVFLKHLKTKHKIRPIMVTASRWACHLPCTILERPTFEVCCTSVSRPAVHRSAAEIELFT